MARRPSVPTTNASPAGACAGAAAPTPPAGSPRSAASARSRLTGALITSIALAGLVLVWRGFSAEWVYRGLTPPSEATSSTAALNAFAEQLHALLQRDPANGEIRTRYANLLGRLGRHERAIEELERALHIQRAQNSLSFQAEVYEKLGQYDRALEVMTDQVTISPSDIDYNRAWLRLLNRRVQVLKAAAAKNPGHPPTPEYAAAQRAFALATYNWMVRAPEDPNSHLFAGNFYVDPLYPALSYKSFLIAFAQLDPAYAFELPGAPMISADDALGTVRQILQGKYAPAYRGLP